MIALFLMAETMGCRASSFLWGLSPIQALTVDVEAWKAGMDEKRRVRERESRRNALRKSMGR